MKEIAGSGGGNNLQRKFNIQLKITGGTFVVDKVITLLWTVFVYILLWLPLTGDTPAVFGQMDLLIHGGLFLILGGLGLYALRPQRNLKKWTLWFSFTIFVAFSTELGQFFLATRSFAVGDLLVNHLGLLGAIIIRSLEEDDYSRLAGYIFSGLLLLGIGGSSTLFSGILANNQHFLDSSIFFMSGIVLVLGGLYLTSREKPAKIWKTFSLLGSLGLVGIISNPSHALYIFGGGLVIFPFGVVLRTRYNFLKPALRYLFSPLLISWFLLGLLPAKISINNTGILIIFGYFELLFAYSLQKKFSYLQTVIPEQVSPE